MAKSRLTPLGDLKYLYLGTAKFDEDVAFYGSVIGAETVWNFAHVGARVASLKVSKGPRLIVADHRPSPSCLPVFGVDDLDATVAELKSRKWKPESGPIEIPDGPCYLFRDRSGNQLAVFGNVRPNMLARHTVAEKRKPKKRAARSR